MPHSQRREAPRTPEHRPQGEWLLTIAVLLVTFAVYMGSATAVGRVKSPQWAYFDHLAQAFLEGRAHLEDPPADNDLTRYKDRWYVAFPPLAAILMLPWVAACGVDSTNTVLFSIAWGAISAAVIWRILRGLAERGWIALGVGDRGWLVLLFALGCVHWYVALEGSVWYLSQTCTVMCIALALWSAIALRSPWPAGIALAAALWARPNVIFAWPLLLGIAAQRIHDAEGMLDRQRVLAWAWRSAIPLVLSVAGLATYNYARFDSPFEFGYTKQKVSGAVLGDLARGQFHPYHIPRNLHIMLFGAPRWYEPETLPVPEGWSLPIPDDHGMSILLTTPALLYLVRTRQRRELFVRSAWLATGLLLVPLLLYYNTGWRQFGYRFSLDFMIPLLMLLAVAAGRRVTWPMRACILAGVLINAWGVVWWFTNWLD